MFQLNKKTTNRNKNYNTKYKSIATININLRIVLLGLKKFDITKDEMFQIQAKEAYSAMLSLVVNSLVGHQVDIKDTTPPDMIQKNIVRLFHITFALSQI